MKVKPVVALGTCCLAAALTAYVLSGCTPDVRFDTPLPPGPHIYFAIILMGALIGLYSRWYNLCFRSTERWLPRLSPWPRHILSALLLGSAVLLLPGLYGDGYTLMESLLAGSDRGLLLFSFFASEHSALALVLACLAMLLLKGALVALANLGGGVAGDFSPTLFAGALAGWLFAFASDWLLGTHMPASAMVCIGMGAAMAGILQSPLMAIFITIEATMAYSMLLPVTLAAYVAFIVARSRSGRADGTMDRVRKPLQNSPVRSKIEGVLHRL